ncbi:VOC family protein [Enterovibrio sp. ZSDZ35]|uniref:VOC family protein n=1 Tax=Enterovibrio qingdaonensis TaxID=2899818 RepID=A0ABT5QRY7_9GAMM|nr:VOC family protein [Enterovibrio sp. ZSDZ35]MDD1783664.1 VOC family protein [Enterovibrio sp. ZSDZ35]
MLNVVAIDHIVLRTEKRAQMIAFYTQVLNCLIERETSPELGLTQLRAGSALIDIVDVDSTLGKLGGKAPANTGNNLDHFCLQIEPICEEKLVEHLKKWHVDASEFEQRYGAQGFGRSIYIQDPDGNTIELKCSIK